MHLIELHNGIHKMMEMYYRFSFWHRGDVTTVKETLIKVMYSFFYSMFPLSLMAGAILSENKDESTMLTDAAIAAAVTAMRQFYIIWRQKDIHELLHRICVFTIKKKDDFILVDKKVKIFMKWSSYLYHYTFVMISFTTVLSPLILGGKKLFFNIGFPLDYKNNVISFWIAYIFIAIEAGVTVISVSFTIIIWYLLFNCGLKYKVLGSELRNMGVDAAVDKRKMSLVEKQNVFKRDLIAGIKSYKDINELTQQLESSLSELFSVHLATSAACICASIYNLAFNTFENIIEFQIYVFALVFNICDIFMVMYMGNEILISSDELSYCLFESNWMEQSQSCKLIVIIFAERLKQAQQLVILKVYPLTLETFTRIMNGAYSMFNILKTMVV